MDKIEYIAENVGIIEKMYLSAFNSLDNLLKESKQCVEIIEAIRRLIDASKIRVKDINIIVSELQELQVKLDDLLPDMKLIDNFFTTLMDVCQASQNLFFVEEYLADVEVGFFNDDRVDESQFPKGSFYVLADESYEKLVSSVVNLILLFRDKGYMETSKSKTYLKLIGKIKELVNSVLFIGNRILPGAMFFYEPGVFIHCKKVAQEIDDQLDYIKFANLLINLYRLLTEAIEGLQETERKYKTKPNKKIKLNSLFRTRDGAEELYTLVYQTMDFIRKNNL